MLQTGDPLLPAPRPMPSRRSSRPAMNALLRTGPANLGTGGSMRQTRAPARRRKTARVTLHILAEARGGGRHIVGWLLDVSVTGVFLRTPTPLPVGTRASIEFCLPGSHHVVRCMAEAMSSLAPTGMGPGGNRFEFVVMRPAQRARLEAFISERIRRRNQPLRIAGAIEISLLGDGDFLDDLTALPSGDPESVGVDSLPDVGRFLEDAPSQSSFEASNDVGTISPDDMVLLT